MSYNTELKPCPTCGRENPVVLSAYEIEDMMEWESPENELLYSDSFAVLCSFKDGGCGTTSGYRDNSHEAINIWNSRPTEEALRAEIKRMAHDHNTELVESYAEARLAEREAIKTVIEKYLKGYLENLKKRGGEIKPDVIIESLTRNIEAIRRRV